MISLFSAVAPLAFALTLPSGGPAPAVVAPDHAAPGIILASASDAEFYRSQILEKAASEERKLADILAYLRGNGIATHKNGDLEMGEYVTTGRSGEPIVNVGASSNLQYTTKSNEDVWVFGLLGGKFMFNDCGGCPQVSITGHVFKVATTAGQLMSGVQAETSVSLIGPNGLRMIRPVMAFPSPTNAYLIRASDFRGNPGAIQGFLRRFNDLSRN